MGDIIETTVAAQQPFMDYDVSGNGLWFEIKAQNIGLVGLLEESGGKVQFWFEYSNPGVIKIIQNSETRVYKSGLPFTLSADSYTRFWIAWDKELLWAGIGKNMQKVIYYPTTMNFNYVTFATSDSPYESHFRFAVQQVAPRVCSLPIEPKLSRGKLKWKRCHDQLPDEAVIGGHIDGEIVYIIRAHHRRSLTPGVFIPSKGLAYIPWGQSDNPTGNFEALCGFDLEWKAGSDDDIPVDAFAGGYSEVNREPMYIGRVTYMGDKIPGKVQLTHKVCYVTREGRVMAFTEYEVLTVPGLNAYCENKNIVISNVLSRYEL